MKTLTLLIFTSFCGTLYAAVPNIIFILADDLGFGDVGVNNPDSKIPTPHLDLMAAEGLRFTDAHSPSAVCTPTRYAYLTGRYAWRTHLKTGVLGVWAPELLETSRITLPEMLKTFGYRTACVGKWHLGWNWPSSWNTSDPASVNWNLPITDGPLDHGFDYYFGDDVPNYPPYAFIENESLQGTPTVVRPAAGGMEDSRAGPAIAGWDQSAVMPAITAKAVDWLKNNSDVPFYLHFTLTAPHTPIVPAEEFLGTSEAGVYGDFVHEVDWSVGEIFKTVRELGLESNTFIFFSADNGTESFTWNRITEYDHDSSYPFRGNKRDSWEGGHRVPTFAWWPGVIDAGTSTGETVSLTDLYATFAAMLGHTLPDNAAEDSYNLLPLLLGAPYSSPLREGTIYHSLGGGFSIRSGKWKFIDGQGSNGGYVYNSGPNQIQPDDPPGQLYDMSVDSSETSNLYENHPDTVASLKALLESYKSGTRSVPTGRAAPDPRIKLTSPADGEELSGPAPVNISWYLAGKAVSLKVVYSMDNGTTWNNIAQVPAGETGGGETDWNVPVGVRGELLVRVSTLDDNVYDETELPVTVGILDMQKLRKKVQLDHRGVRVSSPDPHDLQIFDLSGNMLVKYSGKGISHYYFDKSLPSGVLILRANFMNYSTETLFYRR